MRGQSGIYDCFCTLAKEGEGLKLLTISTLYPNHVDQRHGIFIETRLRHLRAQYPQIQHQVIAPVPWFPLSHPVFGPYGKYAKVARQEPRDGIMIHHPRYLVIPKIGMLLTPLTLALSIWRCGRSLRKSGYRPEVIDGHYFYPDGVAIALAARFFDVPFVVTARGSDISLIAQLTLPRQMIRWVGKKANHLITVCQALKDELSKLAAPDHISVMRNGVDLERFHLSEPAQQLALKSQLGLSGEVMLSVGNLIELKGHHLVIEGLKQLPQMQLVIIGGGEMRAELERLAEQFGVAERIRFTGVMPQAELVDYYRAADLLVLASSREGWANVLLEAMACGTPVVATRVWGTPEVVNSPVAGRLVNRSAKELTEGIRALLAERPERSETRHYAEQFNWQQTSKDQFELFSHLVAERERYTNLIK